MTLTGIIDRLDDWINPIVVKELRQAVKSRLVTVVLLLFLGVQLLIVTVFLIFEQLAPATWSTAGPAANCSRSFRPSCCVPAWC